jgi:hypothetical protein
MTKHEPRNSSNEPTREPVPPACCDSVVLDVCCAAGQKPDCCGGDAERPVACRCQ